MRTTTQKYLRCAQSSNRYPIAKLEWADPIIRWEEFYSTPLAATDVPFGAAHHAALANDGAVWQAVVNNGVLTVYRVANPTSPGGWSNRTVVYTRNTGARSKPHVAAYGTNGVSVIVAELHGSSYRRVSIQLRPSGLIGQTFSPLPLANAYAFIGDNYFCYGIKKTVESIQLVRVGIANVSAINTPYDEFVTSSKDLGFSPPEPFYVYGAGVGTVVICPGAGLVPYSHILGTPQERHQPIIPTDEYDQWYQMNVWSAVSTGSEIWAVARVWRRGSSGLYPLGFDAILRSADGRYWSLDRYSFICLYDNGGTIIPIGDYIYYVGRKVYRAPKNVLWDGRGWQEVDFYSWSIDTGQTWNASGLTVNIPASSAEAIPAGALLRLSCGYRDQDGEHTVQMGVYGVDAIITSTEPGIGTARLQARDLGMRLLYDHAFDFDAVYESCPVGFTDGTSIAPLYPVWGVGVKQTTSTSTAGALEFQGWNKVGLLFSATPLSTTRPQVEATFLYTTAHTSGRPVGLDMLSTGKIARVAMTSIGENVLHSSSVPLATTYGLAGSPRTTGDWSLYGFTWGTRIGYFRDSYYGSANSVVVSRDLKGELIGAARTNRDCGNVGTVWRIGLDGKPLPPFYGFGVVLYAADEYNWVAVGLDLVGRRIVTVACVGAETERGTIYGWHLIDTVALPANGYPILPGYAYRITAVGSDYGKILAQVAAVNPNNGQIVWSNGFYSITVPESFVCNGKTGIILCQPVAETLIENLPNDTDLAVRAWGLWGSTSNALMNNNRKPQDDYSDFRVSSGQQVWRVVIDDGSGEPEICALNSIAPTNWKSCYLRSYAKNRSFLGEKRWFASIPGNRNDYGGWESVNSNGPKCLYVLNGIGIGLYGLVDDDSEMTIPSSGGGVRNVIAFRLVDVGAIQNRSGERWMVFERMGPVTHRIDQLSTVDYIYESSNNFAEAGILPTLRLYNLSNTAPRHHVAGARAHYGQSRVYQHYDEKLFVCDFTAADLKRHLYNLDHVVRDILAKAGVLKPTSRDIFTAALTTQEISIEPGSQLVGNISLRISGSFAVGNKIVIKHSGRGVVLEILNSGSYLLQFWLYDLDGKLLDHHNVYCEWWFDDNNVQMDIGFYDRFVFVRTSESGTVRVLRACRVLETASDSMFSNGKGTLTAKIVGSGSSLTVTVKELYHPIVVATITSGQNAISVLRDAIQDLRLSLWPDSNGSVKYSLLDYPTLTFRDNIGTVSDSLLSGSTHVAMFGIERVRTDRVPTLVQTVGIETTNYLDEAAARRYGLLFMQTSVPSLTEDAAILEGRRVVRNAVSYAQPITVTMAAQPHWEIEDIVTVLETGKTYIVDRITLNGQPGRFEGSAYLRERVT